MKSRRPCSGLWKYRSIGWDGAVTVCCMDPERELCIGNIREADLEAIWNNKKVTEYRIWHILGDFEKMPKCMFCNNMDSPKMSDDEIIQYLKEIKREDLISRYLERMGKRW